MARGQRVDFLFTYTEYKCYLFSGAFFTFGLSAAIGIPVACSELGGALDAANTEYNRIRNQLYSAQQEQEESEAQLARCQNDIEQKKALKCDRESAKNQYEEAANRVQALMEQTVDLADKFQSTLPVVVDLGSHTEVNNSSIDHIQQ